MALRFMDGWDHYATSDIARKWTTRTGTANSVDAANGRNGGGSWLCGASRSSPTSVAQTLAKTLDAQAAWVVGFAYRALVAPSAAIVLLSLLDGATVHVQLVLNTDGTLSVTRNGTALTGGTSTNALTVNAYHYIELKATIADSIAANSCKVRVNGADWITVATGQDTRNAGNASANTIRLGSNSNSISHIHEYDDLYVCDGSGATHNDFLGDVMVSVLRPDGAGDLSQWAPSAGSNWQNVDDTAPDDDGTYNAAAVAGLTDLYALGTLAGTPSAVFGVQWVALVRKDDASTYTLNRSVRSGGADYTGSTAISPGTTYSVAHEILATDPATGLAWTKAGLDSLQAGVKLASVV